MESQFAGEEEDGEHEEIHGGESCAKDEVLG
jgi:hypothetical protein